MKVWEQYTPELVTDLYELTMAESYFQEGMSGEATFDLFVRGCPEERAYFVSAGLEHLLEVLSDFRFTEESLRYLGSLNKFSADFLEYLRKFRFSGKIRAIPEGRIFFAQEPVVEVSGPIIEAQLVETLVLNVIQLETMLASKAARAYGAASGKGLIDFGMRRTHGVDAAVKAARAGYLTGFLGTSNLLAGKIYGIPVFGTMAHSYVTSFDHEIDAFRAFARAFPDNTVLLIDTYDTISGVLKAVEVGREMKSRGQKLAGVRLDSGDLAALSREVRCILDDNGFPEVRIMASGGLDEFKLDALVKANARIDLFAVGTKIVVSADMPNLDIAYKLVEYNDRPVMKLSSGKKTWVGKKQVLRFYDDRGEMAFDRVCLASSMDPGADALLRLEMEDGKRIRPPETLQNIRECFAGEWRRLPEKYKSLRPKVEYPVEFCQSLRDLDSRTVETKRREEISLP